MFPAKSRTVLAAIALAAASAQAQAQTQTQSPAQRAEIEAIVKDYIAKNPELLQGAIEEYVKRRSAQQAAGADKAAVVKANAPLLFASPRQVTLGNPAGDVTLVEFFDYNCGFCKRSTADKLALIKSDPKLKVVLKEMPVLGAGSREAAEVAVAVRMQDADGTKYLAFHQRLMSHRGQANRAAAITAAHDAGLDMARLEKDLGSSEIKDTIEENRKLARELGITGTPSYVVGMRVVPGAVGVAALQQRIAEARK